MPVDPVLVIATVAVVVNFVVLAVVLLPILLRRRDPWRATQAFHGAHGLPAAAHRDGTVPVDVRRDDGSHFGSYDRVVRIASWIYLLATTAIVALTGLWASSRPALAILLATAALFILVVHDLLPKRALGAAKYIIEGSFAITFATLLVALTGGVDSPFFFTFPLIVAGAALIVSPPATAVLTAVATLGYLLAVAGGGPEGLLAPHTLAAVAVNLIALVLLAYVAAVVAREQRASRDAALRLSTIDPLTGLSNRAFFFAALDREIARSARSGRGFCLLMMDLDELKTVNDRFGHFHGDRVLRGVGEVIRAGVRRIDTAARYGGDEFVVLLPETDPTGAFVLAEKMRLGVAELDVELPSRAVRPTLSIGVVSYPDDGATADELMITADEAMYHSKRAGKDRVTGVRIPVATGWGGGRPFDPV